MAKTPHDALFKYTFSQPEHAAGELRTVLPAGLVARIDFSTLTPVPGSFVDEALVGVHTDLLYSVQLAGRPTLLYLLLEHQSTVDPLMAFRIVRYMVRIWDEWLTQHHGAKALPPIVPIVSTTASPGGRPRSRWKTSSTSTTRRARRSARTFRASRSCSTISAPSPTTR